MKKIIVPTDFSDGATNALLHAVQLAKKFDAGIEVVHAFSMPAAGSAVMVDITDILEKNAKEELEAYAEQIEQKQLAEGVDVSYKALHGAVIDVLGRICTSEDYGLVVMGTHGASGFSEKWLGSNAAAASKAVDIPLLIIPSKKAYKDYKNVLFTTDMKVMKNDNPLKILARMMEAYDCEVNFVHVEKSPENSDYADYKNQVSEFLKDDSIQYKIVQNSDVEAGIADAIQNENPDVLVAVRHSRGFFEGLFHSSVSQHIVNTTSVPVLVVAG